ncbi:MAG: OB-fold domain-containing protein [Pseudooceanicola sp.]|nr:OB-fold domain-containing protein [Pseudooceanicola sp.]
MTLSASAPLRRPEPKITPLSAPFWEMANDRTLATPLCNACGQRHFPPGPVCPECLSTDLGWSPVSGRARLVSWVVFHQVYWEDVREDVPYLVATVDLEEGVRLITNLAGAAAEAPVHGMALTVTFVENMSGQLLPVFEAA